MTEELGTYEFKILYFNEANETEETRAGLVVAFSIVDAVTRLASYYGKYEILEILFLKEIVDSDVFDLVDNVDRLSLISYFKRGN